MPEVNLDVSSIQFEEGLHFQVDEHEILLRGESYSNSSSTSSIDDDIVDDFFLSYYPDPLDEFYSDYSFDEVGLSEEEAYHECSMARIGGKNKNRKCGGKNGKVRSWNNVQRPFAGRYKSRKESIRGKQKRTDATRKRIASEKEIETEILLETEGRLKSKNKAKESTRTKQNRNGTLLRRFAARKEIRAEILLARKEKIRSRHVPSVHVERDSDYASVDNYPVLPKESLGIEDGAMYDRLLSILQ